MKKIYWILIIIAIAWIAIASLPLTLGVGGVIGGGVIFAIYLVINRGEPGDRPREVAMKNLYKGLGLGYDEKISNINDVYEKELNKKKEEGYKKRKDDVPTKELKLI